MNLPQQFIRQCRSAGSRTKVADSTGAVLSGKSLLMRSLIFRRLLQREVLAPDEQYVGLLLPPSAGGVLANAAVTLCRRIAVNLNYTVTSSILNYCIARCGIRHVLTSRKFMEKMGFSIDAEVVYLEDFRQRVRLSDKITAAMAAHLMPATLLDRRLGLNQVRGDEVLTVIFTSGSTGNPKGVMLTYDNIASNVEAVDKVVTLKPDDTIGAFLPLFHSFGYTVTMWTVLALDPAGVYHYSPLDANIIGKLCREHRATLLLSTPTFLRNYLKRCDAEDLRTLDVVVAGAEKLPRDLADAFERKFGVRPMEGYGTTELSPLVSVNVPPSRSRSSGVLERKEGSVGRPVPGVQAKVVHAETGEPLPAGQSGMLLITGPNVMLGYLHDDEHTAEALRDGWYVTGDIAYIDEDGFIFITGRESRFSKIGGEMVPHGKVEEAIGRVISADEDELKAVVAAVPDERKGERLVVLHTRLEIAPDEIRRRLADAGLPNIWIPSRDSFFEVDAIPLLGSGKLDLKAMQKLARERAGASDPAVRKADVK